MKVNFVVKNSNNSIVGFILEDGLFYTDYYIKENMDMVDNIGLKKDCEFKCYKNLPIKYYKSLMLDAYQDILEKNPIDKGIQKKLVDWKNGYSHRVLHLEGDSKVGKTTELLKFGYREYEHVIYVDLNEDIYDFYNNVIKDGSYTLSMEKYCRFANLPHYLNSHKTLIILDNIESKINVYNSLYRMKSNLNCDILMASKYFNDITFDVHLLSSCTITYVSM